MPILNLYSIKVLVWDLDGTLHVSPEAANLMKQVFINIVSKEKNIAISQAEEIFLEKTKKITWSKAVGKITGQDEWDVLSELEKNVDRSSFVKRESKLTDLFKKLGRFRHVILTNASHDNAVSTLDLLGFTKRDNNSVSPFEKIFSLDSTKSFKPQAEMFKQVAAYTQLPPKFHLMIGDSLSADILPAKKYNYKTCLVGNYKPVADYCIESIYEIPHLFSFKSQLRSYLKSLY